MFRKHTNNKIIVHNLTFKGIEVVPGVLDFDQRGIVYANSGDIIVTKNKPEQDYLDYLQELGWNFKGVTFLSPSSQENYVYNSVFKDKALISKLSKYKGFYIDTYNATSDEDEFSRKIKLPLCFNASVSQKYGTKSGFRRLCKLLGINVPIGVEGVNSIDDAIKIAGDIFADGYEKLAIKIDEGISGAGNTIISKEEFSKLDSAEKRSLITQAMTKLQQAGEQSAVVFEGWISNVVASPSIQVEVFRNGEYEIISMHDQLLEGDAQWYIGCVYPPNSINDEQSKRLKREVKIIVDQLSREGYYGFLGLDTIINRDGDIYWVEANARKTGTFYPKAIAERLNRGSLNDVYYVATDLINSALKGVKFLNIKLLLDDLLYPIKGENRGIFLYNIGALKDAGRFDIVCFGESPSDAHQLYLEAKSIILEAKSN
ncbi:MAG: preATP grasp domain-containing protein [Paludibacter sp.]